MKWRPFHHRKPWATLHGALLITALLVVSIAATVMIGSFTLAMSWRDEMERDSEALLNEQKIADEILAMTYEQQLVAYRYLQTPDTLHLGIFRVRGDSVYREIQGYLFHELSADARVQVESIKEEHQNFEVAAERAFDVAKSGRLGAALERRQDLDDRASGLQAAVGEFLRARLQQRDALRLQYDMRSRRLHIGLGLVAFGLVVLGVVVSRLLRLRVLRPLHDLASAARRLGEGEAGARVPPQPYEEFDAVGIGFNHMADRVQASTEKLEARNRELREALHHLHSTQEELVQHEKLSAMGQMLAGLAHELNNPLAGVLGMAELLRDELSTATEARVRLLGVDLATPLANEAQRARDLVRSLLSFARKSGDTVGSVSLLSTTRVAIALRSAAFTQAGKKLVIDIAPSLYVEAETQKLEHAIVNLANNALDAMTSGHGTTLRISAVTAPGAMVHLIFDDDGPGFANLRAAFEPFYTTKPAERGTGLGLTLAQKFVDEFGGSITAENREGGGARVTIVLHHADGPAVEEDERPTPKPELAGAAIETSIVTAAEDASEGNDIARPVILVVDDEPTLRNIQRRLLAYENVDVVLAANGEEARHILETQGIDLVISDLRMPGPTDGAGLVAWIGEHQPHLSDRILIVTGDLSGLPAELANDIPPERVLAKPFTRVEYVSRVRAALAPKDWSLPAKA
jgi:signal transduction histidine kinase/CheY-like chemotaxis protein